MKALAAALLVFVAACGQGKAIFNVDVYSSSPGPGQRPVPYIIPPSSSATGSTVQKINLPPGFGSSARGLGPDHKRRRNLSTTSGSGRIGFQLYVAADSAGTYKRRGTRAQPPDTAVSAGPHDQRHDQRGPECRSADGLHAATVWVRLVASGSNPNALPLTPSGQDDSDRLTIRVVVETRSF